MIYKSQTPGYLQEPHFFIAISFKTVFSFLSGFGGCTTSKKSQRRVRLIPYQNLSLKGSWVDSCMTERQSLVVPGNHFLTSPPAPMFGSGGPHVAATDTFVTRRSDLSLAKPTPFFGTILRSYMLFSASGHNGTSG